MNNEFLLGEVDKHNLCQALSGQFTFWGAIPNIDVTFDRHHFLASHFQIQHLTSKVVLYENMETEIVLISPLLIRLEDALGSGWV